MKFPIPFPARTAPIALCFAMALSLGLDAKLVHSTTGHLSALHGGGVKEQILKLFKQQVAAWNEGDLEKFMQTYWKSEQLTFSAGGQTTRGWQATLDRYRKSYSNREKMGHLTFSEFEVTPLGDSAALALGRWHLKLKDGDREGNFSVVLKKIDSKWVIIHDHSSSEKQEEQDN